MIKSVISIMLCLSSFSYSMDTPELADDNTRAFDYSNDTIYRAICERRDIVNDTKADIKKRVSAAHRIYATHKCDGPSIFYAHQGMQGNWLVSPPGDRYACVGASGIMIRHEIKEKLNSISIIPMLGQIVVSYAFNHHGTVFASATKRELCVFDIVCSDEKQPTLRLQRPLYEIQHVTLSDSGNRVAVGVKRSGGLHFMVIDTQENQILHDLPGFPSPDRLRDCGFFYMMGEDIIATCFAPSYRQYDLNVVKIIAELTEKQKSAVATIYKLSERMRKRVYVSRNSLLFLDYATLPFVIRACVSKIVRVVDYQKG